MNYSNLEKVVKIITSSKKISEKIAKDRLEYLEIETGRECNLKCRSCSPHDSTSWDEDLPKLSKQNPLVNRYIEDFKIASLRPKINKLVGNLTYDNYKHLKELQVTGGEPFLSDEFLLFLEQLVEWDLAKNIHLSIFVNCSFFPKEKYKVLLPKFKGVILKLSLDGIGKRGEFLRTNSKWDIVEKVCKSWEEFTLKFETVKIVIHFTVSILNVLYFEEFLLWCNKHFDKRTLHNDSIKLFTFTEPEYMCVTNFRNDIKERIVEELKQQQKRLMSNNDLFEQIIEHVKKPKINPVSVEEFIELTEMLDKARNENWKDLFPRLVKILNTK
jgi:organic radical activating enzyme|tara:strand:- start:1965 stop:2948 length:984 start_codon:yes stop_codon:yes gene_type:complete